MKKNVIVAMLAYVFFLIPLVTEEKNDPFVKYHTKQGFLLFAAAGVNMLVSRLPVFYWLSWILGLGVFALFIVGLMNAASGREKPLPFIGHLADKVTFL